MPVAPKDGSHPDPAPQSPMHVRPSRRGRIELKLRPSFAYFLPAELSTAALLALRRAMPSRPPASRLSPQLSAQRESRAPARAENRRIAGPRSSLQDRKSTRLNSSHLG